MMASLTPLRCSSDRPRNLGGRRRGRRGCLGVGGGVATTTTTTTTTHIPTTSEALVDRDRSVLRLVAACRVIVSLSS